MTLANAPCPACADLRGRLDTVLVILARARWRTGLEGASAAELPMGDWNKMMALLAPPAEGAAPPPGGVG